MTNRNLFCKAKEKCGRDDADLANLLGVSIEAYNAKLSGRAEFTGSEITVLSIIFDSAWGERISDDIFFARKVDY